MCSDEIRYSPKAVEDEAWIESFLARRPKGVLGLVDGGAPYLVTQLYVYDGDERAIYLHGANAGRTKDVVSSTGDAEACFTVSEMGRLIPAEKPVDFTVEYASVDAFGAVSLVTDPADKRRTLEAFMAKFAPQLAAGEDYEPMSEASIDRTSVYRLAVDGWSAKRGEKDPDHPGAYEYEGVRDRRDGRNGRDE